VHRPDEAREKLRRVCTSLSARVPLPQPAQPAAPGDAGQRPLLSLLHRRSPPDTLLTEGHVDDIVSSDCRRTRPAAGHPNGEHQHAIYFGLRQTGAVAPGYRADLLVLMT